MINEHKNVDSTCAYTLNQNYSKSKSYKSKLSIVFVLFSLKYVIDLICFIVLYYFSFKL